MFLVLIFVQFVVGWSFWIKAVVNASFLYNVPRIKNNHLKITSNDSPEVNGERWEQTRHLYLLGEITIYSSSGILDNKISFVRFFICYTHKLRSPFHTRL